MAVGKDAEDHPLLSVHYETDYFDKRQVPLSQAGNAAVTLTDEKEKTLYVHNVPQLRIDPKLQHLADELAQRRRTTESCSPPDSNSSQERCDYQSLLWRVTAEAWRDKLWLYTGASRDYPERGWEREHVLIDHLADLAFSVFDARTDSLTLKLRLADPLGEAGESPVLEMTLAVATGARRESIPLPLADMLMVTCGELDETTIVPDLTGVSGVVDGIDVAVNGTTRAINEDDLKTGQCMLRYSPALVPASLGRRTREAVAGLKHFGRQELEVSLRRGSSEQKFSWDIDPEQEQSIPLPEPPDSKETGVYVVTARLRGPLPPEVVYRPGLDTRDGAARPSLALGDLEFKANLRPRGRHGWVALPIRTFVTFPVEIVGFRFPPNPRELQSSSDNPVAQIVTARTGVLFAIEPWNYDSGSNPWPIPTRLMTGFSLFKFGEGRFLPTLLTGMQVTLPIIDLPKGSPQDQLGLDAAIGFFWEHDLQAGAGDHLLITIGADVLTLFGAK